MGPCAVIVERALVIVERAPNGSSNARPTDLRSR
jgi:hypothetical protein